MIGINSTFNNPFVNLNIKNNNNSSLNSNTSNANVKNLQDTQDTTKTSNKVLGYGVDKEWLFLQAILMKPQDCQKIIKSMLKMLKVL
ncbi:hypothetical protein ACE25U_001313 [Campylobacter coli]